MSKVFLRACRPLIAMLGFVPQLAGAAPDVALRMSVDPVVPVAGQPVEFTVVVTNQGTSSATGVVVNDRLSPALAVPVGMSPFPSTGTYDPSTGSWSIGTLASGASATLLIPAVVVADPQPPCSVNVASVTLAGDDDPSNNRAVAAVKTDVTVRCIDLAIGATGGSLSGCDDTYEMKYWVTVTNAGPDDASTVYLDMTQTPAIIPKLRFSTDGCDGLRCTFASVPAGRSVTANVKTGTLGFNKNKFVTLTFAVSGADADYAPDDNLVADQLSIPKTPECGYYNSGGSGCFIATAAYGSAFEPHVESLRRFRDEYLRRSALGRAFIRFYYRYSPPVAAIVARHASLRLVVRALLTPVVLVIEFPRTTGTLVAAALVLLLAGRRRLRPGSEATGA